MIDNQAGRNEVSLAVRSYGLLAAVSSVFICCIFSHSEGWYSLYLILYVFFFNAHNS